MSKIYQLTNEDLGIRKSVAGTTTFDAIEKAASSGLSRGQLAGNRIEIKGPDLAEDVHFFVEYDNSGLPLIFDVKASLAIPFRGRLRSRDSGNRLESPYTMNDVAKSLNKELYRDRSIGSNVRRYCFEKHLQDCEVSFETERLNGEDFIVAVFDFWGGIDKNITQLASTLAVLRDAYIRLLPECYSSMLENVAEPALENALYSGPEGCVYSVPVNKGATATVYVANTGITPLPSTSKEALSNRFWVFQDLAVREKIVPLQKLLGASLIDTACLSWHQHFNVDIPSVAIDSMKGDKAIIFTYTPLTDDHETILENFKSWATEVIFSTRRKALEDSGAPLLLERPMYDLDGSKLFTCTLSDGEHLGKIAALSKQTTIRQLRTLYFGGDSSSYWARIECSDSIKKNTLGWNYIEIREGDTGVEWGIGQGVSYAYSFHIGQLKDTVPPGEEGRDRLKHAVMSAVSARSWDIMKIFGADNFWIHDYDGTNPVPDLIPSLCMLGCDQVEIIFNFPLNKALDNLVQDAVPIWKQLSKVIAPAIEEARTLIAKSSHKDPNSYELKKLRGQAKSLVKFLKEENIDISTAKAQKAIAKINLKPNWQSLIAQHKL